MNVHSFGMNLIIFSSPIYHYWYEQGTEEYFGWWQFEQRQGLSCGRSLEECSLRDWLFVIEVHNFKRY